MKKRLFLTGLLFSFILLSSLPVFAEGIPAHTFSLSPFLGGYFFSTSDDMKDGVTGGLGFGYNYNKNLGAEFGLHYIDSESEGRRGGDASAWLHHLDALYHFMPDQTLVPYVAGGIGTISIRRQRGSDGTDFLLNWGGGVKYFLRHNLALRADLRHVVPFGGDVRSNLMLGGGVTFFFSGKPVAAAPAPPPEPKAAPEPAPAPAPAPTDSDGDGVPDDDDRCPDTPRNIMVDSNGCPVDSDGDGVFNTKDRCPDTPKGVTVDANGCPLDSDGDGVYDHLDKCPGTPAGAKVDAAGCTVTIEKPVRIELKVLFDTNKAVVKEEFSAELKKVADFMTSYPDTKAVIEGHTDAQGSDEYNRKLSQSRADAVMQYLIQKLGVAAARLSAVGYGESRPVASNDTAAGRAQNRRVVAEISGTVME